MKPVNILVTLLLVTAVNTAPNNCRGRRCRTQGRVNSTTTTPATTTTNVDTTTIADTTTINATTAASSRKRPSLWRPKSRTAATGATTQAVAETVTEAAKELTKEVTEAAAREELTTEEIRRVGVNGWLAAPTAAPTKARITPQRKTDRPGLCETPKAFGIMCMSRKDQCKHDIQCPDSCKCCLVGECGRLCVKPKPTSDDSKEPIKSGNSKKSKEEKEEKVGTKEEVVEQGSKTQPREAVQTTSEATSKTPKDVDKVNTEEDKKKGSDKGTPTETTAAVNKDSTV